MRRSSPGSTFCTPSSSLNDFSPRDAFSASTPGGMWRSVASTVAGFSHGDLLRTGATRATECPARPNAVTSPRTCADAPFRPRTGIPRSGQRYAILTAMSSVVGSSTGQELLMEVTKERQGPVKGDRVEQIARDHPVEIVNLASEAIPEEPLRIHRLLGPLLVPLEIRATGRLHEVGPIPFRIGKELSKAGNVVLQKGHHVGDFEIRIGSHRSVEIDDRPASSRRENLRAAEIAVAEGVGAGIDGRHMCDQELAQIFEKRGVSGLEERDPRDVVRHVVEERANVPRRHARDGQGVDVPVDGADDAQQIAASVWVEGGGQRRPWPSFLEEQPQVSLDAHRGGD